MSEAAKAPPSPLRRGPADPDAPEQIRARILDAATECLLEVGVTGRLHTQIAQRAGLSRPTVYKYVGDQSAILQAVFDREFEVFWRTVVPQLNRAGTHIAAITSVGVSPVNGARPAIIS